MWPLSNTAISVTTYLGDGPDPNLGAADPNAVVLDAASLFDRGGRSGMFSGVAWIATSDGEIHDFAQDEEGRLSMHNSDRRPRRAFAYANDTHYLAQVTTDDEEAPSPVVATYAYMVTDGEMRVKTTSPVLGGAPIDVEAVHTRHSDGTCSYDRSENLSTGQTQVFAYDALNRVKESTYTGTTRKTASTTFGWNGIGHRLSSISSTESPFDTTLGYTGSGGLKSADWGLRELQYRAGFSHQVRGYGHE